VAGGRYRARIRAPYEPERNVPRPQSATTEAEGSAERNQTGLLGGNQAIQRLARAGGGPAAARAALLRGSGNLAIQRLAYVPGKLVTTPSWLSKVKAAVDDEQDYDEQILKSSLGEFVGAGVQKIVPKIKEDHEIYGAYKQLDLFKQQRFREDVDDEKTVSFYNHNLKTKDDNRTKRLVDPSVVWTGKNDLGAEVNPWYACVLISLLKVVGYNQIRARYPDLAAKTGEPDQVREMHRVFFTVKGKHYDDWSGNVPLYQEFGLRFRPIKSTWEKVHQQIPMPAGTYIFAFDTHMMALRVLTDLRNQQQQDGDAAWYQPFTSVFQPGYSLPFNAENQAKPINYLFYVP
jgi:hypothetical protein